MLDNFGQSPLLSDFITRHHLCLQMFEGKHSMNILKIWVQTNVCKKMFSKHLIKNIQKRFKMMGMQTSCY